MNLETTAQLLLFTLVEYVLAVGFEVMTQFMYTLFVYVLAVGFEVVIYFARERLSVNDAVGHSSCEVIYLARVRLSVKDAGGLSSCEVPLLWKQSETKLDGVDALLVSVRSAPALEGIWLSSSWTSTSSFSGSLSSFGWRRVPLLAYVVFSPVLAIERLRRGRALVFASRPLPRLSLRRRDLAHV